MGDLSVGQTKRIKVTDSTGLELTPAQFTVTEDDATIATDSENGDQTERDLTGVAGGTVTVTATGVGDHAGQSGSGTFIVDPASATPLIVELV